MGFAPSPKPRQSRLTPTMAVTEPPKGSRPEGELCVSTLCVMRYFSSKAIAPELSLNTETQNSFLLRKIIAYDFQLLQREGEGAPPCAVPIRYYLFSYPRKFRVIDIKVDF